MPAVINYGTEAQHGKASTYSHGCRCQPCREAKVKAVVAARMERLAAGPSYR